MPYPVRPKPYRDFPNFNGTHGIRAHFNMASNAFNIPALTLGKAVPIGTIAPGALILPAMVNVLTLFNGTTPALVIGTTADDDYYVTAAASAVGTAGYKANLITGAGYTAAYNTDEQVVYAKLTGTGVTAGEVDIYLPFYPKFD